MKTVFLTLLTAIISLHTFGQISKADFANAEVVWYGLDFTQAKLIGSEGFTNPEVIRNDYFEKWNGLFMTEADKYDVKGAFKKANISLNLEVVKPLNQKVDYTTLVIDKPHTITKEDVQKAVKAYKLEQKSGYGISFVVESFDKSTEEASIWVTIFDAKTKEVLVTEKVTGKAGGFGIRNYWAAAVYNVLKTVKDKKIKSWVH